MIHLLFFTFSALAGAGFFFILPALAGSLYEEAFFYPYNEILYKYIDEFQYSVLLCFVVFIFIFFILEVLNLVYSEEELTSRGSARWANKKEYKDLLNSVGVPVGKIGRNIVRLGTYIVTIAGTRSGKGIGSIIPTLLEYPSSLICLDLKGENFAVTFRQRKEFGKVYRINPFNLLNVGTNSFNWLDIIDLNDEGCIEKAEKIASLLVGQTPDSIDAHFDIQAKRLLQGVILLVCTEEDRDKRNICAVSHLIHNLNIADLLKVMSEEERAFGVIKSVGCQFINNSNERELSSIVSTAQRATNFLDTPQIQRTLVKSDFDISSLPDEVSSVYLIFPQDKITDYKAYIKIFFDLVLNSIVSRQKKGKHEVLFILDEVAQLGYMKSFIDAISILRGMGGQLAFYFQSMAQLKTHYKAAANDILANATQIFFGCNEIETAETISKTLGKRTIKETNPATGGVSLVSQELLRPEEIRCLSPEEPIIIMSGRHPIKIRRMSYFKEKEYAGLYSKNPYV